MSVLITPYTEHYMNCYLNNLYSIACSYDSNYKSLSYRNDFCYSIIKNQDKNSLHFDYTNDFYLSIYNAIYKSKHNQQFDILKFPLGERKKIDFEIFKNMPKYLENNQVLFIMIDLFDFNNGNVFYGKIHREHFLLISGFNQNNNEFIVLDDGSKGYGFYNIEYNNLFSLMEKDMPNGYILDISKVRLPSKVEINYDSIKNNTTRLINEIKYILDGLPQISFPINYYEYCEFLIFIQRCFNRHISNKCLLNFLCVNNNTTLGEQLFEINKMLLSNWYNLRARMLKKTFAGEEIQYEKIFQKLQSMFDNEVVFWLLLKKYL